MPPDVMSATQPLLQVEDLKVHFPLPAAGLLRKSAGAGSGKTAPTGSFSTCASLRVTM